MNLQLYPLKNGTIFTRGKVGKRFTCVGKVTSIESLVLWMISTFFFFSSSHVHLETVNFEFTGWLSCQPTGESVTALTHKICAFWCKQFPRKSTTRSISHQVGSGTWTNNTVTAVILYKYKHGNALLFSHSSTTLYLK